MDHQSNDHPFIVVAGNIGAGKSTLTHRLATTLGWKPFYEAFDENPYLEDFYRDMPSWSFHSQIFFLSRRIQHHHALAAYDGPVIQDRSIYEDAEIFARNLFDQGIMAQRDYESYRALYEGVCAFLPPPHVVIYLKTSVGVLAERIAGRGRVFERKISIDYLAQINGLYTQWAEAWSLCPILTIDTDGLNFLQSDQDLQRVVHQLKTLLNNGRS